MFRFCKWKSRAFTLLECLVALFVISGSVLVIQRLTKLARQDIVQMQSSQDKDWESFCNQLRGELSGSQFASCDGQFVYVKKTDDWRFGLPKNAEDFRKSHSNGQGYQPMLYGVKAATMQFSADKEKTAADNSNHGLLTINIDFLKGGERVFLYRF